VPPGRARGRDAVKGDRFREVERLGAEGKEGGVALPRVEFTSVDLAEMNQKRVRREKGERDMGSVLSG
jgi:hypothetical protein